MARVNTRALWIDTGPFAARAAERVPGAPVPGVVGPGTFYPIDPRNLALADKRLAHEFASMLLRTRTFNVDITGTISGSATPAAGTASTFIGSNDSVALADQDYGGLAPISEWNFAGSPVGTGFGTSFVSEEPTSTITFTSIFGDTTFDWSSVFDQFSYNIIGSVVDFPGSNFHTVMPHWNPPNFFHPFLIGVSIGAPGGAGLPMMDGQDISYVIAESAIIHRPYRTKQCGRARIHWPKWWMDNAMHITEIPLFMCDEVDTRGGLAGNAGSRTVDITLDLTITTTRRFGYNPEAPHLASDLDPIWAETGEALQNPLLAHRRMEVLPGIGNFF